MIPEEFTQIDWLAPWYPVPPGLEVELEREVGPGHPLYGRRAVSAARRADCDDVLFFLPGQPSPLAVVHLTWTLTRERDPDWPHTSFYASLEEWVEKCLQPDHAEFTRDGRGSLGRDA